MLLTLKVDIYAAARKLGKILEIDFSFPNTLARHRVNAYPEIQIVSLVVIAAKLCQPFDDIIRFPESFSDPSLLRINWDAWIEIMTEKPVAGIKRGQEIAVTDNDVFKMKEKELDDYLDWYQRTWIDDRDSKSKSIEVTPHTNL